MFLTYLTNSSLLWSLSVFQTEQNKSKAIQLVSRIAQSEDRLNYVLDYRNRDHHTMEHCNNAYYYRTISPHKTLGEVLKIWIYV